MTYVVGIKKHGITTIICDSQVTFDKNEIGIGLKSGIIFPGCIFGGAGRASDIAHFVEYCQIALPHNSNIAEWWSNFERIVNLYDYEKREFALIISSRCAGNPELYTLDSKHKKLTTVKEDFVSIGSGKKLLDNELMAFHNDSFHEELRAKIIAHNCPQIFPYSYCLFLMEKARGEEFKELADDYVGGFFHFSCQLSDRECRQEPAVYLLSRVQPNYKVGDKIVNAILHYIYRICFLPNGHILAVENCDSNKLEVVTTTRGYKQLQEKYTDDVDVIKEGVAGEVRNLPLYYFFGAGFLEKRYRQNMFIHFNSGDAEPPVIDITKSPPQIRPDFLHEITRIFEEAGF